MPSVSFQGDFKVVLGRSHFGQPLETVELPFADPFHFGELEPTRSPTSVNLKVWGALCSGTELFRNFHLRLVSNKTFLKHFTENRGHPCLLLCQS